MVDIEQMMSDRKQGTEGPWAVTGRPVFGHFQGRSDPSDWDGMGHLAVFSVTAGPSHAGPNARRIARVPDLENEVIRLRSVLDKIKIEVGTSTMAWSLADDAITQKESSE